MLSCKQVSLLLSKSRDTHLTLRERIGLRIHLLGCQLCRRYESHLGVLYRAIEQKLAEDNTKLSDETKQRIHQKLSENIRNNE